jgi:hypothetical protein
MRWAGHEALMGRQGMHVEVWWESQNTREHLEDLDLGGKAILKYVLEE